MAVQTVTYTSELPPETVGEWTRYHTLPYFDQNLGNLISVDFTASLNATVDGAAENKAPSPVNGAYIAADADMYVDMINGDRLSLVVNLETAPTDLTAY
ncbi:MAG TPA: choice-of-anchor E domain-containing protein, partial [Methanothrix sp.]|nr:choice-of-anchor E domain-containing protein [Methanothrix sp.]